jgi:hypothetical protein
MRSGLDAEAAQLRSDHQVHGVRLRHPAGGDPEDGLAHHALPKVRQRLHDRISAEIAELSINIFIAARARVSPPRFPTLWDTPKKVRGALTQAYNRLPRLIATLRYRPPPRGCRMFWNKPFSHRRNKDGTIDSICTRCYLRVGTARNESELPKIEHSHTCNPEWLLRWQLLSR